MSETTVGLSNQNDLFGNLFTGTRPITNNSSSPVTETYFVQSETEEKDAENNPENIPFQEILGQQIFNVTAPDAINTQKPNHPTINANTTELLQENVDGTNSSEFYETLISGSSQKNAKTSTFLNPFEAGIDGFSSITKTDEKGFALNPSGKQILDAVHSANILAGTSVEDSETVVQNSGQTPSLKTGVVKDNVRADVYHPPIPGINHQNFSPSPFSAGEPKEIDLQIYKQPINLNGLDSLFNTKASVLQNPSVRNTTSNAEDFGFITSNMHKNLQKLDQNISTIEQEAQTSDSENVLNIKELPASYKSLAQNVSPENRLNILMPEITSQIMASETFMESNLSKVTGKTPSEPDISSISQTQEEGNLSDNFTQQESLSGSSPYDTQIQKTHSQSPFFMDTQIMTDDMLSDKTNFPQKTEVFSGSGVTHSLSIEDRGGNASHAFHRNSTAGIEQTYNIMDQLFQKISLINHGDRSEIKMHLTPPELGSVKIHFTEENDEIEANIFVENAEVKAVIENNAHRLKESIAANGMEINKLEVYVQTNNENKQKSSENHNSHNHHFQARNEENRDGGQSGNERNVSSNVPTEISINMSTLMVDYII